MHVKLAVRWHKAHKRYALALNALDEGLAKEKKPTGKEDLEKRAALIADLGWAHWASAAKASVHKCCPASLPPVFDHELK